MSIHYGQKFGALTLIRQIQTEEFTEYEFGRERLVDKNNNMRVLFTSSSSDIAEYAPLEPLKMTIY
jgi:hypothetical protein